MNTGIIRKNFGSTKTFWILIGMVLLSVFLRDFPALNFIFAPFNQFGVLLHEASHALACLLTGGQVSALTIVEDGNGHGGLTFTQGGIPFIYSQAGYLGETLWGCALIALSRFPNLSRAILVLIGLGIGAISVSFMGAGLLVPGMFMQALGSLIWGLAISGALVWTGAKLSDGWAHGSLMFIAVQLCLSSLQGVWILFLQSLGYFPGTWSDATNMQQLTGIPAPVWGIFWSLFSIGALSWVMWQTFKADHFGAAGKSSQLKLSADPQTQSAKRISAQAEIEAELLHLQQSVDAGQKVKIKKEQPHRR